MKHKLCLGCAGWNIPSAMSGEFPGEGTHLERYARRFSAVEINSTFYRPHRPQTFQRWSDSVPDDFRFCLKFPKAITHELKLQNAELPIEKFLMEAAPLGAKLGCLLVQLPPSLEFDRTLANSFFKALRERTDVSLACEPRHSSWFTKAANALLKKHHVGRVAADPAKVPEASHPDGWPSTVYFRLHGSPRMYYSEYTEPFIDELSRGLKTELSAGHETWCVFDNSTLGASTRDALKVEAKLKS